jgi:hypothetical protein
MFVEGMAMGYSLGSFFQRVVTYHKVGYEIDEKQLPCRQLEFVFDDDS